jgi:uncharacterized protein YukE
VSFDVPELGPCLGRLIVPRRVTELWVPLDDVREALATSVMECAGTARRDASNGAKGGGGARALAALDRDAWTHAWEEAVRRAADRIVAVLDRTIETEAKRVRMPRRRQRLLIVSPVERRAIAARLASGGDTLDEALNQVASATETLARSWPGDAAAQDAWRAAQEAAARRLEAAWLLLEGQVEQERARWTGEMDAVKSWRPSLVPVFVIWAPLAAIGIWLGLVLGGYLPAPQWLAALLGF